MIQVCCPACDKPSFGFYIDENGANPLVGPTIWVLAHPVRDLWYTAQRLRRPFTKRTRLVCSNEDCPGFPLTQLPLEQVEPDQGTEAWKVKDEARMASLL